jgi:hypothetical protein
MRPADLLMIPLLLAIFLLAATGISGLLVIR